MSEDLTDRFLGIPGKNEIFTSTMILVSLSHYGC